MELYKSLRIDESKIGERFGSWTQVGPAFSFRVLPSRTRYRMAVCECNCGSAALVDVGNLATRKSKGCRICGLAKIQAKKVRHGLSKTRVHNIWWGMIVRCENPNVECWGNYGGRGIRVCDRWRNSFEAFLEDMGQPPDGYEIDRKDTNGNYEPDNCKWATVLEQGRNRRSVRVVEFNGKQMKFHELSELCGISSKILRGRVDLGWSVEDAMRTPVCRRFSKQGVA